jgi:hypothetical protein
VYETREEMSIETTMRVENFSTILNEREKCQVNRSLVSCKETSGVKDEMPSSSLPMALDSFPSISLGEESFDQK